MPPGLTPALFGFIPDAIRAARVDQLVREQLADSLGRIFVAAKGVLDLPQDAGRKCLENIRLTPVRPALMALYSDLVGAVFGNNLNAAQILLDQLLAQPAAQPSERFVTLDNASLGAGQAERFLRIISDDGAAKLAFHPLAADQFAAAKAAAMAALDLLAEVPELAGEIDVLLRQIVLVDMRRPPSEVTDLGGSSIFYLWGASFVAFNQTPSRLELAEALAHEAAHVLLFGLSLGKPLVNNDAAARYISPLRDDPRPMEGLVHAAYVLARLTWAMERLGDSGALSVEEAQTARSWEARNRRDFAACLEIIEAEAEFTAVGAAAFAGAVAFMRENQGVAMGCAKARNPSYS